MQNIYLIRIFIFSHLFSHIFILYFVLIESPLQSECSFPFTKFCPQSSYASVDPLIRERLQVLNTAALVWGSMFAPECWTPWRPWGCCSPTWSETRPRRSARPWGRCTTGRNWWRFWAFSGAPAGSRTSPAEGQWGYSCPLAASWNHKEKNPHKEKWHPMRGRGKPGWTACRQIRQLWCCWKASTWTVAPETRQTANSAPQKTSCPTQMGRSTQSFSHLQKETL